MYTTSRYAKPDYHSRGVTEKTKKVFRNKIVHTKRPLALTFSNLVDNNENNAVLSPNGNTQHTQRLDTDPTRTQTHNIAETQNQANLSLQKRLSATRT